MRVTNRALGVSNDCTHESWEVGREVGESVGSDVGGSEVPWDWPGPPSLAPSPSDAPGPSAGSSFEGSSSPESCLPVGADGAEVIAPDGRSGCDADVYSTKSQGEEENEELRTVSSVASVSVCLASPVPEMAVATGVIDGVCRGYTRRRFAGLQCEPPHKRSMSTSVDEARERETKTGVTLDVETSATSSSASAHTAPFPRITCGAVSRFPVARHPPSSSTATKATAAPDCHGFAILKSPGS